MMKLFLLQIGIVTMFAGVLVPIPGLCYSLNRTETTRSLDSSLLAQVASYRPLVDAANQEERLGNQAADRFSAAFAQFLNAPNRDRALKLTNVLIKTSGQAAIHLQRSSELGLQSLPYYAADPSAQTALDTTYRIQTELAQIYRNYNQLSQQTRSAIQANDGAKANVLGTKFAMLDEKKTQLIQISKQVDRAYINRSNAVNAQLINNLNIQMRNGVIQRSRATKCMVSNLPYGSPSQVANNANAYCN
ncbi:hypothetical protein [Chamaesiphon sp. VAR_69_metabat_338]|uniref:hypothetical protein n=1 Tax=Chamaesiphon sp. VAR_69_metabat_338 TaxID=2964704 RepID=UPI00286D784E|nr:hypothetical protein [Chamaesiphon sp. VAR_69_metabat_338]